ncbi:PREDICTED: V-type proton ATPase subunit G3 isoform X1 [Brassica oleracea var. oleracea]|uniref:V-type proton ATPase subunit G3 isoform X1 n=1 Tax=Brassica oleracea var. oleracea TaxID=109376 RepID=UPI0006A716C4|nr:PREDICTED: V-type proton ATPase subunit G3 isoform X1 [Brassica oleracea var. oleracea]
MDSLRGQGGIQMLLTAEQEAGRIVSAARTAKLARMKQAKDEAEKEMEEYRSRLEEEYQTQVSGVTEQEVAAKRLEEETDGRIQNLKESSSKVSKEIVKMLIKYVTTTGAILNTLTS